MVGGGRNFKEKIFMDYYPGGGGGDNCTGDICNFKTVKYVICEA